MARRKSPIIYGCSECRKTWRRWHSAAKHITCIHDGAAQVTEVVIPGLNCPASWLSQPPTDKPAMQNQAYTTQYFVEPTDEDLAGPGFADIGK